MNASTVASDDAPVGILLGYEEDTRDAPTSTLGCSPLARTPSPRAEPTWSRRFDCRRASPRTIGARPPRANRRQRPGRSRTASALGRADPARFPEHFFQHLDLATHTPPTAAGQLP